MKEVGRAASLSALFLLTILIGYASPALAEDVSPLPVILLLDGVRVTATLEADKDGFNPVLAWGNERHPIPEELKPEEVQELRAYRRVEGGFLVRAVQHEITGGYANALFENIVLSVHHTELTGFKVMRTQLEVNYYYRNPLASERQKIVATVDIGAVRPELPRETLKAIAFGDNLMPVVELSRAEYESFDSHSNRLKEWRARVVPAHQLQEAAGRVDVEVLEVPIASLLFVSPASYEENTKRLLAKGLDAEESRGWKLYALKSIALEPNTDRSEKAVLALADLQTKQDKLDLREVSRALVDAEMKEAAAAAAKA